MTRTLLIATLALAVLAIVPGAEASCHYCVENVTNDCVTHHDMGACVDSAGYLATHADHFVMHLIHPDHP